MCGSTAAQNQINDQQMNFYKQLTETYSAQFAQNQEIFNELSKSLAPIIAAGASQQGFSPQELAAQRSQAIDQAGSSYANQLQAIQQAQASRGGGNAFVPSGGALQLQQAIASSAENQEANSLNQITQNNYATGRQNYFNAVGALSGVPASLENPLSGSANSATGAGSAAASEANAIQQANSSWVGLLGGLAGGISYSKGGFTV